MNQNCQNRTDRFFTMSLQCLYNIRILRFVVLFFFLKSFLQHSKYIDRILRVVVQQALLNVKDIKILYYEK